MYYYIEKDKQAPSGVALIISFPTWDVISNIGGNPLIEPLDYKVMHDEVAYLGGTVKDLIGYGIQRQRITSIRAEIIERIFE